MKTIKKKKGRGRPLIEVNWQRVDDMLKCQASGEIIADLIGVDYKTLERRCKREQGKKFGEYAKQKKQVGKNLIRMKMLKKALSGDTALLIFLSKNWLGMADKPQDLETRREIVLNYSVDKLKQSIEKK